MQTVFTASRSSRSPRYRRRGPRVGRAGMPPAPAAAAARSSARGFVLAHRRGPVRVRRLAHGHVHGRGDASTRQTTIPRALVAGTIIVTVCYVALNAVYLRVLPLDARRASPTSPPMPPALLGRAGARLVVGLVLVSTFGAVNGDDPRRAARVPLDGAGRPAVPMARRGAPDVPDAASRDRSCRRYGRRVLVATNTYGALFTRVVYTEWIFFAAMAWGLFRLRRRRADYPPPYRVPGYRCSPRSSSRRRSSSSSTQIAAAPVASADGLGSSCWSAARVLPLVRTNAAVDRRSQPLLSRRSTWRRCGPAIGAVDVTQRRRGNPVVHYPGDYNVMVPRASRHRVSAGSARQRTESTSR